LYGPELGAEVYGWLFISMALASNVGTFVTDFLLPVFEKWIYVFIFFGVLTIISFVLNVFFNPHPKPPVLKKHK
jgi:hypothetical protein